MEFDGTIKKLVADALSTLYEDHLSPTGPGVVPDGLGLIKLGTLRVIGGAEGGASSGSARCAYCAVFQTAASLERIFNEDPEGERQAAKKLHLNRARTTRQ